MPEPFSATAPIKSLSGTATNPGVSFTGDEDTGLYRSGANELAVTVGGAEAAKFTATGMEIDGDISLDDGGTYTTTLQTVTPTAARTISFPDATGTVGLVGGSSGNLVVNQSGAYAGVANSSVDNATSDITLGSRFISSLNGAASAPPGTFTGTWFTGGTATTTKPQVLIEPTGATSTAWSTSGTGLGVNAASGFAGNLLDLQVNGTSQASIASNGAITTNTGANQSCLRFSTGAFGAASYAGLVAWSTGAVANHTNSNVVFALKADDLHLKLTGAFVFGRDGLETPAAYIRSDAAGVVAQRNATNAQTSRVYNTYTSATSYERAKLEWSSNVLRIGTEKGSAGGTARDMELQTDGTTRITVKADGAILFSGVPTSNPAVAGQLWNDGGTLKISAG
jgi:hypothetical protein